MRTLNFVFLFLLFLLITPLVSSAQMANDGSDEPRPVRQERIRGYRRQSSELQKKITDLGSTANSTVLIPVLFGVDIDDLSPNFGDPRSGGRSHEGEDIMAVKGTPIVSPTAAVVLRTGVGATEGNYVYTANPGGETFVYMHLDKIGDGVASGVVLKQGDLIGYVGNTGNASGGAAHLHFEIHNSSNDPVDPFPRLTGEISLSEKISYLSEILIKSSDATSLAELLVTNFRNTFNLATAQNITLPSQITLALNSVPVSTTPSTEPRESPQSLPLGDLELGSSGSLVIELQKYLIAKAVGPSATRLTQAGATGSFGPLTQQALIEFQKSVGISPASGYYGPLTRAFVAANPVGSTNPDTPVSSPTNPSNDEATLTRDLKQGMTGEDVRTLQKRLNSLGFTVAASGSGSLGNETTYFGPATLAAVIKFQLAKNISPAAGYVGPITRAALK